MIIKMITNPFQYFTDNNGEPLESGLIYIGEAGLNPEANPITIFWDRDFLYPAAQPVSTINGLPVRGGTPSAIYTPETDYSILVRNKNQEIIYSVLTSSEGVAVDLVDTTSPQKLSNKTFVLPWIADTSEDHTYRVIVNELTANREIELPLLTTNDEIVFKDHPATLDAKTLTNAILNAPTLNDPTLNDAVLDTSVSGSAFQDDDTFASVAADKFASSKSIKAYVASQAVANKEIFTSSGTFTVPENVTSILATAMGGGGGGASGFSGGSPFTAGGGGGGGKAAINYLVTGLTPLNDITVTIGGGGVGGVGAGNNGSNGDPTILVGHLTVQGGIAASGQTGGAGRVGGGTGGDGGTNTSVGSVGNDASLYGDGGAGGAVTGSLSGGGGGGGSIFDNGGNGGDGDADGSVGVLGSGGGGGGGWQSDGDGGAGGDGILIITW
jgi:hypothetical protein